MYTFAYHTSERNIRFLFFLNLFSVLYNERQAGIYQWKRQFVDGTLAELGSVDITDAQVLMRAC